MNQALHSDDQLTVAKALVDYQIAHIEKSDPLVAGRVRDLRKIVWEHPEPMEAAQKQDQVKALLAGLSDEQTAQLCSAFARMGELYNLSGLTSRDNYFEKVEQGTLMGPDPSEDVKSDFPRKRNLVQLPATNVPGGVAEFVKDQPDVATALGKLSTPVFEQILTMHPTGVMGLKPMKALRRIALAIRSGDEEAVKGAVAAYQDTPVLHQNAEGKDANMGVRDEVKTVMYCLGNVYDDAASIFSQFDKPLNDSFKDEYNPLELRLNARFGSWAGGDKDGNNTVTAEVTLEALIRHTHEIVGRYEHDLQDIQDTHLDGWKARLGGAHKALEELLAKAEALTNETNAMRDPAVKASGDPAEFSKRFEELSGELAEIRKGLDARQLEQDLTSVYQQQGDDAEKALEMVRKVRWFEFNFSKLEYRETAEEYSKVLSVLIDGYADMTGAQRAQALTQALNGDMDVSKAAALMQKGTDRHLKEDGVEAIAYHTLRRMELARDHPAMIRDNVLAECGAIAHKPGDPDPTPEEVAQQGVVNMLEAQFLQKVVGANKDGRETLMGIVPLFEDPSTMQNIDKIMEALYENPAYQKHMDLLVEDRGYDKRTQQVQIAHSDNRRRAGSLAGTAFIHEAHHKVRDLNNKYGIATQFYEGGSWTDAFRNGVRSITAQVNAYGLHDFAKFTVQGVSDLNGYLNHPGAIERLITRQLVHPASKIGWSDEDQKWEANTQSNGARVPNTVMNEVASNALKHTLADYTKDDFSSKTIGIIMDAIGLGYQREAEVANRGSRAAMRGASVKVGSIIQGIAVDKLRTIPFSAVQQLNSLTPSWVGAQNLNIYLYDEVSRKLEEVQAKGPEELTLQEREFTMVFKDVPPGKTTEKEKTEAITPMHVKALYDGSPTFRDAMDKAAFAIARTDMDGMAANVVRNLDSSRVEDESIRTGGKDYLKTLKLTYQKVGSVIYKALLGRDPKFVNIEPRYRRSPKDTQDNAFGDVQSRALEALQQAHSKEAIDALNGLGPEIFRRNQFLDVVNTLKNELNEHEKLGEADNGLAVLTAAGQASVLGRFVEADDPAMAKRRHEEHAQQMQLAAGY